MIDRWERVTELYAIPFQVMWMCVCVLMFAIVCRDNEGYSILSLGLSALIRIEIKSSAKIDIWSHTVLMNSRSDRINTHCAKILINTRRHKESGDRRARERVYVCPDINFMHYPHQ